MPWIPWLSFDGKNFDSQVDARFEHRLTKLSSYNGEPFVTGDWQNTKTEIFNIQAGEWSKVESYPFSSK